jgi:hypothetical protein
MARVSDQFPHLRELEDFLEALNNESDRGAVLIASTMIEDLLGRSIRAFLVEDGKVDRLLDGFNAPLGTFSARVLGAFSLGLLSEEEFQECETVRKIRNQFAHNVHPSFEQQKTKDLCRNLKFGVQDVEKVLDAKLQYTFSATALIIDLYNRSRRAAEKRLAYNQWQI